MPIYEYACSACDHRTDILHGINDPGPHFCPSCGQEGTMRKQFAPPTIHFKGSGWAKKDRGASSVRHTKPAAASTSEGGTGSGTGDTPAGGISSSDSASKAPSTPTGSGD